MVCARAVNATLWRHALFDHWQTTFQRLVWTVLRLTSRHSPRSQARLGIWEFIHIVDVPNWISSVFFMAQKFDQSQRNTKVYSVCVWNIMLVGVCRSVDVMDRRTAGCINSEYIGFPIESRRIPAGFVTAASGACDCDTILTIGFPSIRAKIDCNLNLDTGKISWTDDITLTNEILWNTYKDRDVLILTHDIKEFTWSHSHTRIHIWNSQKNIEIAEQ